MGNNPIPRVEERTGKMNYNEARIYLLDLCKEHGLVLTEKGKCGFCRSCIGILAGSSYLDYNPFDSTNYEPIEGLQQDIYKYLPENIYHKHNCFAVLVDTDNNDDVENAVIELAECFEKLHEDFKVEVVEYDKNSDNEMQVLLTGSTGRSIKLTEK